MNGVERVMPKSIEFDEATSTDTYGRFFAEPLERGFGVTLGNSLRRVLLSSLPGAAIISAKIEGVQHEFSTIPHVKEDVTDIIFQLKQVRLRYAGNEQKNATIEKKGPGVVKAGDIEFGSDVDVLTPDIKIATLDKGGAMSMELVIDRGKGYVPGELLRLPNQPIGVIPVDAIFSPVTKTNYLVEETRVGQRTDYDKLTMEVWTDGSISPDAALRSAAEILTDHLHSFALCGRPDAESIEDVVGTGEVDENLFRSLSEFELSVRAANCLKSSQILLVGDLVQRTESEMLKFKNFGKKSLAELEEVLDSMELEFGMDLGEATVKALEEKRKDLQENAASKED